AWPSTRRDSARRRSRRSHWSGRWAWRIREEAPPTGQPPASSRRERDEGAASASAFSNTPILKQTACLRAPWPNPSLHSYRNTNQQTVIGATPPHLEPEHAAGRRRVREIVRLSDGDDLIRRSGPAGRSREIECVLRNRLPPHEHAVSHHRGRAVWPRREPEERDRATDAVRQIHQTKPRRVPKPEDDRVRVGLTVDLERVRTVPWRAFEEDRVVIGFRDGPDVVDDQGALEPGHLLAHLVEVRVVHERARARRREARDERIPRCDRWREMRSGTAEARRSIHVAVLDLDAVPVDARRLVEMVDDRDRDRLTAHEVDLRTPVGVIVD